MSNNIEFLTLENEHLKITLCTLGASIYRIQYYGDDMVVTPKETSDFFRDDIYFGKTIGDVCGRILVDGKVQLHGGPEGLSRKNFEFEINNKNEVVFVYKTTKVFYELLDDGLLVTFEATTDNKKLLSLTNHAYFCLGESSIDQLFLRMHASQYISYDKDLIPVQMNRISEPFIFDEYKQLGLMDIDNFFIVDDKTINLKSSKYELTIKSDFEGAQIFTDHFRNNVKTTLSDNDFYRGVAIEPQDSQLDRRYLGTKQIYKKEIVYTFKRIKEK